MRGIRKYRPLVFTRRRLVAGEEGWLFERASGGRHVARQGRPAAIPLRSLPSGGPLGRPPANGRRFKIVRLAVTEVGDSIAQSGLFDGSDEIFERRFEYGVIVVMNGHGLLRIHQTNHLHALPRVHRHQNAKNPCPCPSPKLDSSAFSTTSIVFHPTKIFEIKI